MRRLLLALLLTVAGLTAAAGPASSRPAGARGAARDFEARVPVRAVASVAARRRVGPVTTRVVRAPGRFDLVGFKWRAPLHASIRIRVKRAGGRWSPWVPASDAGDHGAPRASDPVWAGGADFYQLRLARRVSGLRAHFVSVPRTARPVARAASASRTAAAPPPIIPRSSWDPDHQCNPTHAPTYGRVDMAFVHHTVNANDYSPADSAAIVLAICRYHVHSNGWWDIGYNFLVDRYGQVFEGRYGGTTKPVIGAQAQGYNSVSTGISNIGTFETEGQTSPGLRALGKLIGWKLALHGVPISGKITETSLGGADNRYPEGTKVVFQRVSGHRDGDATSCPGTALYAQLPEIRGLAAAAAGAVAPKTALTLAGTPLTASTGRPVTLAGRLTLSDGAPTTGSVVVERASGTGWALLGTAGVGADGSWTLSLRPRTSLVVRARWTGDPTHPEVTSTSFGLDVSPALTLTVARAQIPVGGRAVFSGRVAPAGRRVFVLARRGRIVSHFVVRPSADGRFTLGVRLHYAAAYSFVATTRTDTRNVAGRSRAVVVRTILASRGGGAGPG